jgi:hypothetical protein
MSLERIVGIRNIPAALIVLVIMDLTGTALGDWYEAKNLLEGSLGSKRPHVSLLERKETYSMTSDASKQTPG